MGIGHSTGTGFVLLVLLVLLAPAGCRPDDAERPAAAPMPGESASAESVSTGLDLVDVHEVEASIGTDIRYAGSNNFVGTPADGYETATCLLSRPAAEALAGVQHELAADGLGLLVYDCYRPQRAVDHFVRWAADTADLSTKAEFYPHVDKSRLFEEGYIAERSGHSRGSTVDLTLVRVSGAEGDAILDVDAAEPLDMGTPYDFFDPRSHTESPEITERQLANRLLLREAMEAGGFQNYTAEWWHYTLLDEPHPDSYFDIPIRP